MFKYFFLDRIRDRGDIFWCLVFPLILMTCFKVAFGNLSTNQVIDTKKVAIIHVEDSAGEEESTEAVAETAGDAEAEAEAFAAGFDAFAKGLTEEGTNDESALFELYVCDETGSRAAPEDEEKLDSEEAAVNKALINGELDMAFKVYGDKVETLLPIDYSDTACAIGKAVANGYMNNCAMIQAAFETDPMRAMEIIDELGESIDFVSAKPSDFVDDDPNPYIWYFYSTLIMGILFNAMAGVNMMAKLKADVGYHAMRVSVGPKKKSSLILSLYSSNLLIALAINAIQIVIMKYVFYVPMGKNPVKLAALIVASNLFSLALGTVLGSILKGTADSRTGKTTGIIMFSSFLSGEMICVLPGAIEKTVPIINDINPATIMNMAMYRLAYSNKDFDFYTNLIKIVVLAVVFLSISIMILRREKYASV